MIRILIFILSAVLLAGTVTVLSSFDSRISGEAFGVRFDAHSGVIIGFFLLALATAIYVTHVTKNIIEIPTKMRARDKEAKRARGVTALTRGLEAVAVGDGTAAAHHARIARRHLDDLALTRLLSAQAAQISGDGDGAQKSYQAMLEAPETEFLGLKGLYLSAVHDGAEEKARGFAARAFELRPNARWAFDAVFDHGLKAGSWRETRDAVEQAARNKLISAQEARRAAAALLTADAYTSETSGDNTAALTEGEKALKSASDFAPAAVLAATLHTDAGSKGKAMKALETAYASAPHVALVACAQTISTEQPAEKRAGFFERLVKKNPDARESALLTAKAHVLRENWEGAVDALEPFSADMFYAHEITVMAEAIAGHSGDEAAKPWFERAAHAPRDPRPGAEGVFNLTREGWGALVKEYAFHNRLSPPPLEDIRVAVPLDDVRQLLAPPVEVPPVEVSDEEENVPETEGIKALTSDDAVNLPDGEGATPPPADYVDGDLVVEDKP